MATYYVSTSGVDTNPGSLLSPFRTMAKALSVMVTGDTMFIRGGTYVESINSNVQTIPTGTSYSNAPLISAYNGETVTIRELNLPATYLQYIIFKDLRCTLAYQGVSVGGLAHHLKFVNVQVGFTTNNGWQFGPSTSFLWVLGGNAHDADTGNLPPPPGYPMYLAGGNHIIDGVEIYNGKRHGIIIYNAVAPLPTNNIVRNCRIHNCGLQAPSHAALLVSGINTVAYNNLVYANTSHGIQTHQLAANAKVYNNTVYGGNESGLHAVLSTGATFRNNISYGNRTFQFLDEGTGTIQDHNITTNPLFANAAGLDFHLLSGSPAINAGLTVAEVITDYDGITRGNPPEAGAYEFGGLDLTPPAAPTGVTVT